MEISTVATTPNHGSISLKYSSGFNIVGQIYISLFVLLFGHRNSIKYCGNIIKTFFLGSFCKTGIHIGILVIFACRGFF